MLIKKREHFKNFLNKPFPSTVEPSRAVAFLSQRAQTSHSRPRAGLQLRVSWECRMFTLPEAQAVVERSGHDFIAKNSWPKHTWISRFDLCVIYLQIYYLF